METGIRREEQASGRWSPRPAPSRSTEGAVPSLVTLRINRARSFEACAREAAAVTQSEGNHNDKGYSSGKAD